MAVPVLVKRIIEAYQRQPPGRAWDQFLDEGSPELFDLQVVCNDLREDYLTPAERSQIDRIDRRRDELQTGGTTISYRDFGAGTPDAPRTEQQRTDGVAGQRRVCDLAEASVPRAWGLVLFRLIRRYQPARLIELGSALGISGAYQVAALKLNGRGHLFTLEGCPEMARYARRTARGIDAERGTVVRGRFQDTLPGILARMGQVDFAFIDGHHDEQATLDYWHQVHHRLTARSFVVFDDIDWSAGMRRAWRRIKASRVVSCSIDLGKFGLCLCLDRRFASPRHFKLTFPPDPE